MTSIITWIKLGGAALCSALAFMVGGFDTLIKVLLILSVIDYITGISAAIVTKKLSSQTGFYGILKKIAILCVVACSHLLGQTMGIEHIRTAVIGFYIANEGISIAENSARLGVPLPKKLMEILSQLKEKEDDNDL